MRNLLSSVKKPFFTDTTRLFFKCFGVSAGLMALIYFCIGIPFFGNSVLVLDLNGQYVYFFESLHNIIYDGDASLLYSWQRALGGEYMGIFAYYLASPLSFLVALMPTKIITESLYVMILVKVGLAGGTMGYYLHKTYPAKSRNVILFSALYALCAWSVMYGNNVMWLDTLILFPLVIRGADLLLSGRNWLLYTLSLAMTILTHFYMGYMVCIFLVIYFFYYHIFRRSDPSYNESGRKAHFLRSGLSFAGCSLLAALLASVIILPAVYSLSLGKNTFTDPTYEFTFKLNFLDIIYKLFPFATDTLRREGLPFLYCGTAALIGGFLFFASEKIKIREKLGTGLLLLTLVFCFSVSVIDIWWHGGQEPNWLNYRYSFIFSFILLVAAYRGWDEIEKASTKRLMTVPLVMLCFLPVLQALGYAKKKEFSDEFAEKLYEGDLFFYFACVLLLGGVIAGLLYFKKQKDGKIKKRILTVTVLVEILLSGVMGEIGLAFDVGFCGRADYTDFMAQIKPAVSYIQSIDDSFYRMDKTFHRQPADAMALGMRSLSVTTSTLNRQTLAFLDKMGYAAGSYWSKYSGGNPVSDMLLDVKYVITKDTSYDVIYQRVYTDEENGIYGYLNPYALSLGYVVDNAAESIDFDAYDSPVELMNALTVSMTGNGENKCFSPITALTSVDGFDTGSAAGHTLYTKNGAGKLTYTFISPDNSFAYLCLPTDYPRECALTLDGKDCGTVLGNDTDCIIPLGRLKAGEMHTLTLTAKEEKIYIKKGCSVLYSLDEQALSDTYNTLSSGIFRIGADYKEDELAGEITAEKNGLLFTSIPYDKGWIIELDGRKVDALTYVSEKDDDNADKDERLPYADALIAVPISKGTHTLKFTYRPSSVTYGNLLSLAGVIILVIASVIDYALIRPSKRKRAGAEGQDAEESKEDIATDAESIAESAALESSASTEEVKEQSAGLPETEVEENCPESTAKEDSDK